MSEQMLTLQPAITCGPSGDAGACNRCVGCQISICSHVDHAGLARLRSMSKPAMYAKGERLFTQGDPLNQISIVSSGIVKLFHALPDGQNQITGFLGPGDILGGIRRIESANSTATTLTKVEACTFERRKFLKLIEDYPSLCLNLLIAATDEIEALNDHIILLGRKRAPERLAAFLLMLGHRWKSGDEDATVVHLPMSRADIADHLGLTVETISRTFAQFRDAGLISTPRPTVVVLNNLAVLYHMSGFDEIPANRISLGL